MDFKAGQIVKAKQNAPYSHTAGDAVLKVVSVEDDTCMRVEIIKARSGSSYGVVGKVFPVDPDFFTKANRSVVNK